MQSRMSGGKKCNQDEIFAKEQTAWMKRTVEGKTHQQIADDMGMTRSAITKMLQRVSARALKELKERVELMKVEQNDRLDHLFFEAMEAWNQSKNALSDSPDGPKVPGDPRFLDQMRNVLGDKRKLWGLNAPTKVEATESSHGIIRVIETVVRTREEATALLANPPASSTETVS